MAVALVMIKIWKSALEFSRRPVGTSNLRQLEIGAAIQLGRPADVVTNEQIELSVVVIIDPGSAGTPAVACSAHSGGLGHVAKLSAPFVAEQPISANTRNENIHQAVVIVIAYGDAHPIKAYIQA